ncbi:hypothetical protein PR048_024114 [Dryococelus australis]|uniref:Uncharacterized protein n=1 Tax=Dryococelus australis TaxID=614101 RepID=A0ABQ9GW49_9NEOP|nr:hypothetical protein PR048_024114 [Dryococelus australis]
MIFNTAQDLLRAVDEEITVPRIVSRQKHRANINAGDPETYLRITIMIPQLDDFIGQLESRFTTHKSTLTSLYSLIPSVCSKNKCDFKEDHFELYQKLLDWGSLEVEFQVWQTKWQQLPGSDRPTCALEALGECNKDLFPNIQKLLKKFGYTTSYDFYFLKDILDSEMSENVSSKVETAPARKD